jgi:hypothetical protein
MVVIVAPLNLHGFISHSLLVEKDRESEVRHSRVL